MFPGKKVLPRSKFRNAGAERKEEKNGFSLSLFLFFVFSLLEGKNVEERQFSPCIVRFAESSTFGLILRTNLKLCTKIKLDLEKTCIKILLRPTSNESIKLWSTDTSTLRPSGLLIPSLILNLVL